METPAKLSVSTEGDVTIIHLPQELIDSLDIATVREQWREYVQATKPGKVVIDFNAVRTCGSEAVGGLVHLATTVRAYGGDIKLCSMSKRIRTIFDICRLIPTVFEAYDSAGESVEVFLRVKE